jgi:hypothetical protein
MRVTMMEGDTDRKRGDTQVRHCCLLEPSLLLIPGRGCPQLGLIDLGALAYLFKDNGDKSPHSCPLG